PPAKHPGQNSIQFPPTRRDIYGKIRKQKIRSSFPCRPSNGGKHALTETALFRENPASQRSRHHDIYGGCSNPIRHTPKHKLIKGGAAGEPPQCDRSQEYAQPNGFPAAPSIRSDTPRQLS